MDDRPKPKDPARRCRLSDPAHPHILCYRGRDDWPSSLCYRCGDATEYDEDYTWNDGHYYCEICDVVFHEMCSIMPQALRHPYHPNHPLYPTARFSETKIQSFKNGLPEMFTYLEDHPVSYTDMVFDFKSDNACHWCGKDLGILFYRCLECDFRLDLYCLMLEDPPFTITKSESHQHPLTLIPKPLEEPCSSTACGLGGNKEVGYGCDACNYVVHKKCIVLPQIITQTVPHQDHVVDTPCLPPPLTLPLGGSHES